MRANFWKNKKVLITGINGFVGSNLAKELIKLGAKVHGISLYKNKNSLLYIEKIEKKCRLYNGDISNYKFLNKIIKKDKFEILFHLAAQVEVGVANKNPFRTWETNIRGTYNLLNSILNKKNIKAIIVASSDKSYGSYPKKLLPYKENYHSKAIFPYDVSKACADMISQTYASELYNLPIVTTRFSNIYGPGQTHFSALIPDLARSLIKNKDFIPRGNGTDIRDYVYIKDIVDLYLLLAKRLFKNPNLKGEIFNAGTNQPLKVKDIVRKFYFHKNQKKKYSKVIKVMKKKKTKGEIPYQFMDYSKLKKYFGWKPKYNFKDTIDEVYEWYLKSLQNK